MADSHRVKIKITFFIPTLEMGGVVRFFINLINNIDREKFDLSILVGKKNGIFLSEVPEDVKIVDLNVSHIRYSIFSIVRYLKKEKPDIFVSFFPHFNLISIISRILSGSKTKIIISERSTFSRLPKYWAYNVYNRFIFSFIYPFLVKIFYHCADEIICVSKGVADDLAKVIGGSKKIKVIYNYFDFEKIIKLSKEDIDCPKIYNNGIPIICAVGLLVKEKDYPMLLNAFSIVSKSVKSHLVIVGEGRDREKLEMLTQKLGIFDDVYFVGLQKNPYKFMARSEVFVLSSMLEGMPNVLVEAMICGIPVVSTDCKSGPNEVLSNGENGFLVPVGDARAMASAILKLLNDKDLRKKFSNRGKEAVLQQFSFGKTIKEYENTFIKIFNQRIS